MRGLIQGAIKDHRLPHGYKFYMSQPSSSKAFLQGAKKVFIGKLIRRQYVSVPLFVFFGLALPYLGLQTLIKYKQTGTLPMIM